MSFTHNKIGSDEFTLFAYERGQPFTVLCTQIIAVSDRFKNAAILVNARRIIIINAVLQFIRVCYNFIQFLNSFIVC